MVVYRGQIKPRAMLSMQFSWFFMSCRWRRWRLCDGRAYCLPKPRWALLGSRFPFTMHKNYPDSTNSDAPLLFSLSPSVQSSPILKTMHVLKTYGLPQESKHRWQIFFI